jgi:hypothetical protein
MVRQLFEVGVLQSGFWHQFDDTHSPGLVSRVGVVKKPKRLELLLTILIIPIQQESIMINSVLDSRNPLFNFMHGICFDYNCRIGLI